MGEGGSGPVGGDTHRGGIVWTSFDSHGRRVEATGVVPALNENRGVRTQSNEKDPAVFEDAREEDRRPSHPRLYVGRDLDFPFRNSPQTFRARSPN